MAPDDLPELLDLFPSWRSLLWTIAGLVAGVVLYKYLEPWKYAAWTAIVVGFLVTGFGIAWHARRNRG